ncbi:peptidase S41 [Flaviaesturariibacter flavus]|uniref:Tricorn protease homolog n=1 Tax=Flaviaesturariibacter flavus TaxID=2502780 RepID=A0A4R1B422_9BACT|nr:S41 family peptidase [Flaviaesturariibacter flavus]TCJ12661.1 peptidase S41 [Flaviaesturariibacter flavus]
MLNPQRSLLAALLLAAAAPASAQNTTDTRLLWQPAVSKNAIAFIYAEDLWVAARDGSYPRRITVSEGAESNPVFSPDGSTIAFTAQYDGNTDVFVVPAAGGVPRRLTWHPGADLVRDFTPDGRKILFASQRSSFTNRYYQLYTVDIQTGAEQQLPIPNAFWASYSPDGNSIAYTTIPDRFEQWKNYRGGTASRIWVYDTKSHNVTEIPKPKGGANDSKPVWKGNKVYFRSDRNGEFNIYSYDVATKAVTQHTKFTDFPVSSLEGSNDAIVFSQAGYLHLLNPATGNASKLKIGIAADLLDQRERYVKGEQYIRGGDISPSGARVVMDYRGEILTLPAQKGDVFNLTNTPGVHEKSPSWSPDGKLICYFSDASGEYELHVKNQDGSGETRVIKPNGSGFYNAPHWSPDSKKIAFVDNGRRLYMADVTTGKVTRIAEDTHFVPGTFRDLFGSWSADANHIAYTTITETNFERAWIYSLAEGKSSPVTDALSNVTEPTFDPSGKYLYVLSSTDAGPVVNWFDQSNNDMESTNGIYLITLQKSVPSPFAKENELELIPDSTTKAPYKADSSRTRLRIDWDGIQNRIVPLPLAKGRFSSLSAVKEGELFYLAAAPHNATPTMLNMYSLKKRKEESIMPADGYNIAAKGEKTLFVTKGKWGIAATGQKPVPESMINTAALQVKINPKEEWKNIFNEAWRVNRDFFYDPNMHGVNWAAMKKKYEALLPDVASNNDLYRVMQWMFSELSVGHHRFDAAGDRRANPETVPGGLLGADYETVGNRYRIKKIYGGLNWTPELRSPLTEPGANVQVGDFILKVNGADVTADKNFYSYFENTADKIVTLTVASSADGANTRTVKVVPVASEAALRNRDWVEGNMRKVNEATNGQIAYVYVPNTAALGHEYFKRYFYPQANKAGIIVDERFNGGGQLADYYIDLLKRPLNSYWRYRYGKDQKAPNASIQGPKVMLIDETAGSGGDYLPYLFRQARLGTLVGKTTWGGLVGVLGYPEFIDGGVVTAPNVAFFDEKGFGIENVGTPPDVEVEQWPSAVIAGHDPQLEKAIQIALDELKAHPLPQAPQPKAPVKTMRP